MLSDLANAMAQHTRGTMSFRSLLKSTTETTSSMKLPTKVILPRRRLMLAVKTTAKGVEINGVLFSELFLSEIRIEK